MKKLLSIIFVLSLILTSAVAIPAAAAESGLKTVVLRTGAAVNNIDGDNYFTSNISPIFTPADVVDGKISKTWRVRNDNSFAIKLRLEFQTTVNGKWVGPTVGNYVTVEPNAIETISYSADVNQDNTVTIDGQNMPLASLWVRIDVYKTDNTAAFGAPVQYTLECEEKDVHMFETIWSSGNIWTGSLSTEPFEPGETAPATSVIFQSIANPDDDHHYFTSNISPVFTENDVTDGQITRSWKVRNDNDFPIKVMLEFQGNWETPVPGKYVWINPGKVQTLTYSVPVNEDMTVSCENGNYAIGSLWVRLNVLNTDNTGVFDTPVRFAVECQGFDLEMFKNIWAPGNFWTTSTASVPFEADEIILGDINTDGITTAEDLPLFQGLILGLMENTVQIQSVSDLNSDGEVNIIDFVMLKKLLVNTVK